MPSVQGWQNAWQLIINLNSQEPCEKVKHYLQMRLREVKCHAQGHRDVCGRAGKWTQGCWPFTLCLSYNNIFSSMHHMACIMCVAASPWQVHEQQHDVMSVDVSMWLLIQTDLRKNMVEFKELNRLNWPPQKKCMPFNRSFECIQSTLLHVPKSHKFQRFFFSFEPPHLCSQGMCWPKYRNVKFFLSFFLPHSLFFFPVGYLCAR